MHMKIALISSTVEPKDGYGNVTYELSQALHAAGVDCTLFLPKSQKVAAEALALPFPIAPVLPEYVFRIFQRAGPQYFQSFDVQAFDLVHDLLAFPYCIPATISARRAGKPLVMGAQGTHGVRPMTY